MCTSVRPVGEVVVEDSEPCPRKEVVVEGPVRCEPKQRSGMPRVCKVSKVTRWRVDGGVEW